jgi:uncharacterized Zn ribbon protein
MTQEDTISCREFWVSDKFSFKAAVTPTAAQTGWAVSNVTTDRTIDANGATAEIGDGLCTLIQDLIAKGILSA